MTLFHAQTGFHAGTGSGTAPLLMIHGGLSRHERLLPLAAELADRFKIVLVDLPGHGRSPDWDGTGDVQAVCVEAVAPFAAPGGTILGHSFGGTIALRLALEQPERAGRLVLIEPVVFAAATGPVRQAHDAGFVPVQQAWAAGDRLAATQIFLDLWEPGTFTSMPPRAQESASRRLGLILAAEPALSHDIGGMLAPGRLEALRIPVTLVRGARSPEIIAPIHAELLRRLPNAREVVVEGAGHMLPLTHVAAVAAAV